MEMKLFALLLTVVMTYGVVGVVTEPPTRETPLGEAGSAVWALTFEGLAAANAEAVLTASECYDERPCAFNQHEMYTEPFFLRGYLDQHDCMLPANHSGPIFDCYGEFGMTVDEVLELEARAAVAIAKRGDTNMRLSPSGNEIDLMNCSLDKVAARIPLSALDR
jgi:hypothetical protein